MMVKNFDSQLFPIILKQQQKEKDRIKDKKEKKKGKRNLTCTIEVRVRGKTRRNLDSSLFLLTAHIENHSQLSKILPLPWLG